MEIHHPGDVYYGDVKTGEWVHLGYTSGRVEPPPSAFTDAERRQIERIAFGPLHGSITMTMQGEWAVSSMHMLTLAFTPARRLGKHRRRCVICNPRCYVPPLPIDGRAYHARQRRRSR